MTEHSVIVALRVLIASLSGLALENVIRSYGSLPQREDPYIAIRTLSNEGTAANENPIGSGIYSQGRRLTVQLDAVGQSAFDGFSRLHLLARARGPMKADLAALEIGIGRISPVRNLTRPGPQGWEPVRSFDLLLSYVQTEEATPTPEAESLILSMETDTIGEVVIYDDKGSIAAIFPSRTLTPGILPVISGILPL